MTPASKWRLRLAGWLLRDSNMEIRQGRLNELEDVLTEMRGCRKFPPATHAWVPDSTSFIKTYNGWEDAR